MCLKNRYNAQNKVSKTACFMTWSPPVNYLRAEARSDDAEIQIKLFCSRNTYIHVASHCNSEKVSLKKMIESLKSLRDLVKFCIKFKVDIGTSPHSL